MFAKEFKEEINWFWLDVIENCEKIENEFVALNELRDEKVCYRQSRCKIERRFYFKLHKLRKVSQ